MTELERLLYAHVQTLFPICRSITGNGLRATLNYIRDCVPLDITEVPSGTQVLDWTVPFEWVVRGAQIRRLDGDLVLDFADNNLHLVQYSEPVDAVVSRAGLEAHLHSLPEQPDLVPYRTSYYNPEWGFCLSHNHRQRLTDAAYHVRIDTNLVEGSLSYGELLLPGTCAEEVLLSAHCCHPSLANDNLSAIAVAIELARHLAMRPRRLSYRFLFAPGTIGAISWLQANRHRLDILRHGLILTCLGDDGAPSYKRSCRGDAPIDRYVAYVMTQEGHADRILPFEPVGYDERQYGSPGFALPVGRLSRSPGGTFPEYHTSADNLSFVKPAALADSLRVMLRIIDMIERDGTFLNTAPCGEPQLGRRGLYGPAVSQVGADGFDLSSLLWVLNRSDGGRSLLDIAVESGKPFDSIAAAADRLRQAGLLRIADGLQPSHRPHEDVSHLDAARQS